MVGAFGFTIKVEGLLPNGEVKHMKDSTTFPNEFRDSLIGVIALLLTLIIWAVLFAPVAI